jgi:hypothetical protein
MSREAAKQLGGILGGISSPKGEAGLLIKTLKLYILLSKKE